MLLYIHQLDANCVCLLFTAEWGVHTGFLELFHRKQLPVAVEDNAMRAVRVKPWAGKLNNELKHCKAKRSCRFRFITMADTDFRF